MNAKADEVLPDIENYNIKLYFDGGESIDITSLVEPEIRKKLARPSDEGGYYNFGVLTPHIVGAVERWDYLGDGSCHIEPLKSPNDTFGTLESEVFNAMSATISNERQLNALHEIIEGIFNRYHEDRERSLWTRYLAE